MFSKETFQNNKHIFRKVGDTINEPFEKPLHEVYSKLQCLSPINSLAHHISRGIPAVTEDWLTTWNKNFISFNS